MICLACTKLCIFSLPLTKKFEIIFDIHLIFFSVNTLISEKTHTIFKFDSKYSSFLKFTQHKQS